MERATRIALDVALVSLKTIHPAVSKMWFSAKTSIEKTAVKPLVFNPVVRVLETKLDHFMSVLISKITILRDRQLTGEIKYLEKELEKIKNKVKAVRPTLGIAWQYAKVEMVPPMTLSFFNGPGGTALEDKVGGAVDGFIASLQGKMNEIEAERERKIKEQDEAIKAAAKKKEEERQQKEAQMKAKATQEAKAKAEKAKEEAKKADETKKAVEKKAAAKSEKDEKKKK